MHLGRLTGFIRSVALFVEQHFITIVFRTTSTFILVRACTLVTFAIKTELIRTEVSGGNISKTIRTGTNTSRSGGDQSIRRGTIKTSRCI